MCPRVIGLFSFSACLALVEDMNWEIAATDPKQKIQIGSFRIDPQGRQDLREVAV